MYDKLQHYKGNLKAQASEKLQGIQARLLFPLSLF